MKKLILAVAAVVAAATLSSCMGTGSMTNYDTAKPEVKANEAYEMTAEKAAGLYAVDSMDRVGVTEKDSYKVNTILLNADGTFEFNVEIDEMKNTVNGKYTVEPNGVVKFDEEFSVVASGETVVCDGNKLTVEGKLGRSTITMNYAKTTAEDLAEADETPAE